MNMIEELTYIIGGLALTHSFYGNSKLLKHLTNSRPVNLAHLIFCLLGPLVIWQHIYQYIEQLNNNPACLIPPFFVSLTAIFSLSVLVAISLTLYPSDISYSMDDVKFINYLKRHRRIFYFLILLYLSSVTINNIILGTERPLPIFLPRLLTCVAAGFCFFINIEVSQTSNSRINVNLRIPYFIREPNRLGFDIEKKVKFFKLFSFAKKKYDFPQWQAHFYNKLDLLAALIMVSSFLVILLVRNW